jgi:hypothetical protein
VEEAEEKEKEKEEKKRRIIKPLGQSACPLTGSQMNSLRAANVLPTPVGTWDWSQGRGGDRLPSP